MIRILHISDLHFGAPFDPRAAEAVLGLAEASRFDAVVASGDITQRARREEFAQAREYLSRFAPTPVLTVPGNHDVPLYRLRERLVDPLGLYREYLSSDLDPVLQLDGATLLGLNSTAPYRAITNGRIRKVQLQRAREVFAQVPASAARIVVAHHHFAPVPYRRRDQVMPKARRAIDCFCQLGVDIVLGGHLHSAYVVNSLDLYPGDVSEHGIVIVQCGTTTSTRGSGRERRRNSLHVIEIETDKFTVVPHMLIEATARFEPMRWLTFPRATRSPRTGLDRGVADTE